MVTGSREEMIKSNIGLVHSIANRFRGRGTDYDDLFQSGCVGLIKAVDNFDESKGFAFSTYAVPVIMGEIRRIFRDGGAIKVSRSLKEKAIKAQALREKFINRELREPTVKELSDMLDCTAEETAEILNVISPLVSLNSCGEDGENTIDIPVDESEQLFDRISVHQLMKHLDKTEQSLIDMRYYKGYTQAKTAKALGISQVQVSRKEKAILIKLRNLMQT
ncbi:MAG: sigma-70 family RNA polymerase sigma factor [Clostridiales bacterium]|nr:sigma-70 family RNA polymerase sigma factor [Clostridiales bacterium]